MQIAKIVSYLIITTTFLMLCACAVDKSIGQKEESDSFIPDINQFWNLCSVETRTKSIHSFHPFAQDYYTPSDVVVQEIGIERVIKNSDFCVDGVVKITNKEVLKWFDEKQTKPWLVKITGEAKITNIAYGNPELKEQVIPFCVKGVTRMTMASGKDSIEPLIYNINVWSGIDINQIKEKIPLTIFGQGSGDKISIIRVLPGSLNSVKDDYRTIKELESLPREEFVNQRLDLADKFESIDLLTYLYRSTFPKLIWVEKWDGPSDDSGNKTDFIAKYNLDTGLNKTIGLIERLFENKERLTPFRKSIAYGFAIVTLSRYIEKPKRSHIPRQVLDESQKEILMNLVLQALSEIKTIKEGIN